ncbi:MAG: multidrug effflux MFS transporter [Rhodobacterales bacterium]|nr:multidrug effflux MFS transporter [Rhodobacterales bacterium]NCT12093.1 multidrug effflux MFS transporter [Rhodobacterales bacterium]
MTSAPAVRFLDRNTPPHVSTLMLIAGISALNMSIFLPSLAAMAVWFDTDYALMQLSVSAYLAVTALLQVVIGPISDRFGRRPVILWSMAIFVVATIGAVYAPSVEVFLAFRMMQGAVASAMVLSRAIVRDMFPQEQAASVIGYVTMGMALVPMVGPVVGGVLDEAFGWQATFWFLAACGIGVGLLCYFDQGETVAGRGISFADQFRSYPELLRSQRFWGYVLCAAFASGAFFAFLGGASFVAGDVYGLSAVWTGAALGAPAIGYAVGNFVSGRYSVRFGINRMILAGTLITAAGMGLSLLLSLAGVHSALIFFSFCTTVGLGNGLVMPNATAGMLSVRPHLAGTASGLGGAILIGGGAALSAVAGALLVPGSGALPLQVIMFLTALCAGASILWVIRRERFLNG